MAPSRTLIASAQASEIGEQPGTALSVRKGGLVLANERQQIAPRDAALLRRPVAPPVRWLDGEVVFPTAQLGLGLLDLFHIVEELEEHDPSEHRETVEVRGEALVLSHDVARGLDQPTQRLTRRGRYCSSLPLSSGHRSSR